MTPALSDDPRQVFDRVPFMRLLGLQRERSEGGRARLALPPQPELGNVIGAVHGGALATLLDVAMASAAVSARDFVQTAVTLALHTQFIAPGTGRLVADAQWLHSDGDVAHCRATVTDGQGQLVAQGQGTFRYLPRPHGTAASPT
ncbi:MAG: PaaI family thioesterase [Rubrivivax sp.]|nr:PaaI family thioesterase [Rubrivivax sp.]